MRIGAFPGTFAPPTLAHLAVAEALRRRHDLHRVDLILSRAPIGKATVDEAAFAGRVAVLEAVARRLGWLGVVVSDRRLIADLAEGYDVVVMGADKWHQVNDAAFYDGSADARDAALARLPAVSVVPRAGHEAPADLVLDIGDEHLHVSSTRARAGELHLMVPEARASGLWTPPAPA